MPKKQEKESTLTYDVKLLYFQLEENVITPKKYDNIEKEDDFFGEEEY